MGHDTGNGHSTPNVDPTAQTPVVGSGPDRQGSGAVPIGVAADNPNVGFSRTVLSRVWC